MPTTQPSDERKQLSDERDQPSDERRGGGWRRPRLIVAASVLAVSAAALAGSVTASHASQRARPSHPSTPAVAASTDHARGGGSGATLHFNVHFSPFDLVDIDHSGQNFTNGDEIVFHDQLFSRGRHRGDEGGSCVIIDGRVALANCTGALRLHGGLISYQFLNQPPPNKTLVITGGTGRYLDAGGYGRLHEDSTGPTGTLTLHLTDAGRG
jgi:hypothetical protein